MPEDRRLAAIMFTDIVGYTALMGSDEDKAFKVLRKNREIHRPLIKKYRGKWLKEMGDGILASFNSPSDAVRCANEIQIASKKVGIPLRIGVHEGEVVFEGGEILGDGVNVASRLEELAEEGCTNISDAVYKNIKNKAGIIAKFIDEKTLKNVDEPIKVYRVHCDESIEDKIESSKDQKLIKTGIKSKYYLLAGGIVIIVALFLIWQYMPIKESVELDKSIAVLPFDYLNEDQNKRYQADGVMNTIISHLNKIKELRVIAKISTEKYRDNPTDPREIGNELNVSYLLEGSFQMIENDVRLSFGLISTIDGGTVWFDEYDRKWEDIFKLQSEVAQTIANEIKVIITPEEKRNIETITTSDITAYEYYLRGEEYRNRSFEEQNYRYTIQMYEKAIEIDPEFTLAWVGLAAASRYIYWFYYDRSEEHLSKTKHYLDKALSLSPQSKEVLLEEGLYQYHCRFDYPKALQILEKLKADYPNDDELYFWIGAVYRRMGEFRKSLENTDHAISLNSSEWSYWQSAGLTLRFLNEYNQAEEYLKKVIDLNPSIYEPYWFLVNLYSLTGDVKKAKEFLKNNPEFIDHPAIILLRGNIEVLDGNYEKAIQITESLSDGTINQSDYFGSKHLQLGLIYFIISNEEMAVKHFETERIFLEEKIKELNNDSRLYSSLGIIYAGLGMKEEAIEAGRKAIEILGFNKDASGGFYNEMDLTKILLMVEEYDEVLSRLEFLLNQNGNISVELLKIDPFWNPIKDMERFKEIISNPKYQVSLLDN